MINATVEGRTFTKDIRVNKLKENSIDNSVPSSYTTNSDAEKICLAIISDFQSEFKKDNPYLLEHFIACENEYQISKCVCTTLKPELLPYPAVYDVDGCSEFVSQYLDYEPLKDPCKPPTCLPSPSQVLSWEVGDCFDLSNLLASFLIGAGYDAYVVFGIAPKWICTRDRSNSSFAMNQDICSSQQSTLRHTLKSVDDVINDMKVQKNQENMDSHQFYNNNNQDEDSDSLHGQRIHCWVVVKAGFRCSPGTTDFFVEPSTGEKYSCQTKHPYLQIFALWNTQNYWINKINDELPLEINIDCTDRWQAVFYNSSFTTERTSTTNERKPFDPPFSWVQRLSIPQESFSFRYPPHGKRVTLRKQLKLENFSEGVHKQGLLKRITVYEDENMLQMRHCEEYFGKARADNLIRRIRLEKDQSFHEDYASWHSYSLSEWIERSGERRIIHFREKGRIDGLVTHDECFGKVLVHCYSGRGDGLYERTSCLKQINNAKSKTKGSFIITTTDGTQNSAVTKITEKYKQPIHDTNERHIAARIFLLVEKSVITEYFKYDGGIEREIITYSNERNQESSSPGKNCYYENQQKVMNAEKTTVAALRIINQEITDLVRMRKREEDVLRVDFSKKDDCNSINIEKAPIPELRQEKDTTFHHLQYLSPFLLHVEDIENITKEEAIQIKDAALATCKERLLQRADIIQNRLHEESIKLVDVQAKYQRDIEKTNETKKSFENASSKLTFRIKILEKRLQDHEDVSVEKYKALESKIINDLNLT